MTQAEAAYKLLHPSAREMGDDWYTIDEFTKHCTDGMFIDSDGSGFYAIDTEHYYSLPAIPSLFRRGLIWDNFTHVAWFNK